MTSPAVPQAAAAPRIALLGATGAIGASIAQALSAAGTPFSVVGRSAAGLSTAFGAHPLATQRIWNPDDAASLRAAVRGMDTLVHMVGVPYDAFHLHPRLMRAVVEAAEAEGVRRVRVALSWCRHALVTIGRGHVHGHSCQHSSPDPLPL